MTDTAGTCAHTIKTLGEKLQPLRFDVAVDAAQFTRDDALGEGLRAYVGLYRLDESALSARALGTATLAGRRLAVQYFTPRELPARGTLVLVHGLYDHIGIYQDAITLGLEAGFCVLAVDLPGHGLSEGAPATIDSFDTYSDCLRDLVALAKDHPECFPAPFYALGQSTGGAILLNLYARTPNTAAQIDKTVLMAPLLWPRGWRLGRFAHALLRPWVKTLKRGLSSSSHNRERLAFINHHDPLQANILSLQWLSAMRDFHQAFMRRPINPQPLLIVQGTADTTLDWRYNLMQFRKKLPAARIHMIEGAEHQLLNERDDLREAALGAAREYLFSTEAGRAKAHPLSSQ